MPCNSDYLNPNQREREMQRAAKLLVYVHQQTGKTPPAFAVKEAANIYARDERSVVDLCRFLRAMNDDDRERLVYNAKDKLARELADWWEAHQAADAAREAGKSVEEQRKAAAKAGLAKLTDEEKKALGI